MTDGILHHIQRMESKFNIKSLSKNCFYDLSPVLEAWMQGEKFDKILNLTEADEGEIIRYFRMSIQILHEILDAPISFELKEKVKKAVGLINRGIIDAEKQLRM